MTLHLDRDTLRDFGRRVVEEAGRELGLLDAIEATLDRLRFEEKMFGALAEHADYIAERLYSAKSNGNPIDPQGEMAQLFESAQSLADRYHQQLTHKRDVAKADSRLCDDDCIVDAFNNAIAVAADLHNAINRLRWAIGEHDANLEKPKGKVFTDVDALFADMGI